MKMDDNKKQFKEARSKARVEARNARKAAAKITSERKPRVKGENTCPAWNDPKLKEKRAKRKAHLKALAEAREKAYIPQAISYPKFNRNKKLAENQAKFDMMLITMRQAKVASTKQSKEDKAKYKASLVAFKETHVRTYKVQENYMLDADKKHSRKKNRGFARKSTAKIYQMKKAKQAA